MQNVRGVYPGLCQESLLSPRWMNCPSKPAIVKPKKIKRLQDPKMEKVQLFVGKCRCHFPWGLKACRGLNRRQHPVDAQGMGTTIQYGGIFLLDVAPFQKRCPFSYDVGGWIAKLLPSMNRSVSFSAVAERVMQWGGVASHCTAVSTYGIAWFLWCWCYFFPKRFWESTVWK